MRLSSGGGRAVIQRQRCQRVHPLRLRRGHGQSGGRGKRPVGTVHAADGGGAGIGRTGQQPVHLTRRGDLRTGGIGHTHRRIPRGRGNPHRHGLHPLQMQGVHAGAATGGDGYGVILLFRRQAHRAAARHGVAAVIGRSRHHNGIGDHRKGVVRLIR